MGMLCQEEYRTFQILFIPGISEISSLFLGYNLQDWDEPAEQEPRNKFAWLCPVLRVFFSGSWMTCRSKENCGSREIIAFMKTTYEISHDSQISLLPNDSLPM